MVDSLPWSSLEFAIYVSDQVFRSNDTCILLESFIKNKPQDIPEHIRNCFSSCCKNKIAQYRNAVRSLDVLVLREENSYSDSVNIINEIRKKCVEQITEAKNFACHYAELFVHMPTASAETRVFAMKMIGDYSRYMAEVVTPNDEFVEQSLRAYSEASDLAVDLSPDHIGKLGLALNRSVFYYEIMNDPKQAVSIANEAFAAAYAKYDEDEQNMSDDATNIIQLIKDNLTLWKVGDDDSLDKSSNDDL